VTWWLWILLWILLVAGSLALAFLALRSLWRKGMALARELADVSDQFAALADDRGAQPGAGSGAPETDGTGPLAVFRSPVQLRVERLQARRTRPARATPPAAGRLERDRLPRRA
jgi:hypothetical protein